MWTAPLLFSSLQRSYRDNGLRGVALQIAKKLLRPALQFGKLVFFECNLGHPLPEPCPVPGILCREAFRHDIDLFGPAGAGKRQSAVERFDRDERCFVGIDTA